MSNIATTISQSRKLIELGLDETTANMYYPYLGAGQYGDTPRIGFPIEHSGGRDIPAWSLSALLEMMPKKYEPDLQRHPSTGEWFFLIMFQEKPYSYLTHDYYNPIDAAYEMVCWLLEQGLIKKGGQDGN